MKKRCVIRYLLPTLLVVSGAVAQTANGPATDALSEPSGISAARSKYLEKADAAATKGSQTEAQLPRRGRRMPIPPHRGYNGGNYPTPWASSDPGHVLIGAGIGFAIGATIGAVAATENGKSVGNAVCLGGPLFALLGAAIGASHGSGHPFIHRRRYPVWPEEDEEGGHRSPAIEKNSQPVLSASRKPALPNPLRDAEASGTTSPETSSRPEQRPSRQAPSDDSAATKLSTQPGKAAGDAQTLPRPKNPVDLGQCLQWEEAEMTRGASYKSTGGHACYQR